MFFLSIIQIGWPLSLLLLDILFVSHIHSLWGLLFSMTAYLLSFFGVCFFTECSTTFSVFFCVLYYKEGDRDPVLRVEDRLEAWWPRLENDLLYLFQKVWRIVKIVIYVSSIFKTPFYFLRYTLHGCMIHTVLSHVSIILEQNKKKLSWNWEKIKVKKLKIGLTDGKEKWLYWWSVLFSTFSFIGVNVMTICLILPYQWRQ